VVAQISRLTIPSGPPPRRPSRRVRLLALVCVRDERDQVPGLVANLAPHVDGLLVLDDGSVDGTGEWLAAQPSVLEVLRVERGPWNEPRNHRLLVAAGVRHGADWLLSIDADERVEEQFRDRAERVIRRGVGLRAFAVHLRELWDAEDRWRVDGIWGRKSVARLFRALPDHEFDDAPLHGHKAPLQARVLGRFAPADLVVYHRAMLTADARAARRARYERLDPEAAHQAIGYAYLTDESGLRVEPLPPGRGWRE
jgi:glycosyltransferase involved in cell wall biosynthesis